MSGYVVPRLSEQISVRLPAGMRQALAERASANGRSSNSEVVVILADALGFSREQTTAGEKFGDRTPAVVPNEPLAGGSSTHAR